MRYPELEFRNKYESTCAGLYKWAMRHNSQLYVFTSECVCAGSTEIAFCID